MPANLFNLIFIAALSQVNELPSNSLKNMSVTQGIYSDRIIVEWEKTGSELYTVARSSFKTGEFTILVKTADTKFEDLTAEKGVRYWYKVIPSVESDLSVGDDKFISNEEYNAIIETAYTEPSVKTKENETSIEKEKTEINEISKPVSYSGFTSIDTPSGLNVSALVKLKKSRLIIPQGAEEKKKQKLQLEYIEQYYIHPVKLSLFMTIAKPYIDKGDLKILVNCDTFEIQTELNQTIFYDKNYNYMVVFESKKFVRILTESRDSGLDMILLKNSDLYCLPKGRTFVVDKNGVTRLVNVFDAVGISTGYLKNDKEWKSRTIMLATSRSDLKDKLKNASSSGE